MVNPRRRRAVILVGNPAHPYSRAIRLGRTLTTLGYDVEIAATNQVDLPREERDGELVIRRYPPTGPFARDSATGQLPPAERAAGRSRSMVARIWRSRRARIAGWIWWPLPVRGWLHTLERELPPADLYHSCGTLPITAALDAQARDRRAGRTSTVIFDVIDITFDSNNVFAIPRPILSLLERRERGWARSSDAHTAVNDVFADRAASSWGLSRRPSVVPNYPEPWSPPAEPPDRIRAATGLPPSTRICMFWGRLGPYVGLDEAAEAVLQVPDTALVVLGFGRGWDKSIARDADPRYAGRHFTLPAVHPDELASWVASADVALCTLPPLSYNQRHTIPNKFLEAMTGGTPMVLGPNLPIMEELLRREELGQVAPSMAPADIAAAIRSILDLPVEERMAWRERIQTVARERYSWPIAAEEYVGLIRTLEARSPVG